MMAETLSQQWFLHLQRSEVLPTLQTTAVFPTSYPAIRSWVLVQILWVVDPEKKRGNTKLEVFLTRNYLRTSTSRLSETQLSCMNRTSTF